jgi:2-phosphosulfolactate phosphatase
MKVEILYLTDGAKQARGLTVVIDVFRAFSTACYTFGNGAKKIIPLGNIDTAYTLKKENPDFLLIGERDGMKPKGFDYGNSPTQIEDIDFKNKTIVQTTSAGTQGIANATNSDEIITGSFVNAQAIINYINKQNPEKVSLVAMGSSGIRIADEDILCAKYIKNALENKTNDFPKIIEHLREYRSAHKFFDPKKDWAPERDFDLCLSLDKFNFVLKVKSDGKNHVFFNKIEM